MKRCRTLSVKRCRILELPLHLLYDILRRLTVETIFSCKCVCKTFLETLTDPHFVELHLTKAPDINDGLIFLDREFTSNLILAYDSGLGAESLKKRRKRNRLGAEKQDYDHANSNSRPCQTLGVPATASQFYKLFTFIVGACNGLLCVSYFGNNMHRIYYICSPVLGEFFALPPIVDSPVNECSGFGFCPKTKQYKVIRFINRQTAMIYTLGKGYYWRKIDNAPYPQGLWSFDSCLNGNLHWIIERTMILNMICSFNLETEQCSYISPPAHLNLDGIGKAYQLRLGSFRGLLCLSYYWLGSQYEVFVMKDYGVKGCWTKELSLNLTSNSIMRGRSFNSVARCLNNRDLLLVCDHSSVVCFNIRKGTTRNIFTGKGYVYDVHSFVPSFISLKDIAVAEGGNVEVVQRKMRHNLPSKKNGTRSLV